MQAVKAGALTPPSSGRPKAGFAHFVPPLMSNVMPPLNLARTWRQGRVEVVAPRRASGHGRSERAVAHGQAGLLTEPARVRRSGSVLALRRAWRVVASGRPWVRAARLSRWGRVVACLHSAFVGGAAHNSSSERTSKGVPPLAAAQLQR